MAKRRHLDNTITIGQLPQEYVNTHGSMAVVTPKGVRTTLAEAYKNYNQTPINPNDVPGLTDYLIKQDQPDISEQAHLNKIAGDRFVHQLGKERDQALMAIAAGVFGGGALASGLALAPVATLGSIGGSVAGEKIFNNLYKGNWGQDVERWTNGYIPAEYGEYLHPGTLIGGGIGEAAAGRVFNLAKFAGRDITNSWRTMRYQLAHPESQIYGIVPKDIEFLTNRGDNPYVIAIKGGKEVGRLTMGKSGNAVNVHTIDVSPELRRQGLATELYKQANKFANSIGRPLESHSFQHQLTAVDDVGRRYAPATKVWEKMIADGLATKERRGMEMIYRMNKPTEAIIDESNYMTATDDVWDAAYDKAVYDYLEDIVDDDAAVQKIRDLHFKAKAPKADMPDQYHGTHDVIDDRIRFHTADGYLPNYPFYTSSVEDYARAYGPNVYRFKVNQQLEKLARASKPTQFIRQTKDDVKALMQQGKEGTINDKLWTFNDIGYPFDEITVYDGRKYKLANAITYDKDGNIIPISKRDNFNLNNINYSWLLPFLVGSGLAAKNK